MALRIEGRMAYDKFKESSDPAYNSTGLVGLAFFIGGGPPKDTDADGVPDRKDKCAATPRGARARISRRSFFGSTAAPRELCRSDRSAPGTRTICGSR